MKNKSLTPQIRFKGYEDEWSRLPLKETFSLIPFKQYISEPSFGGKYPIIQQGNSPILGYSSQNPCLDFENTLVIGDHTMSVFYPKMPFLVASDGVKILKSSLLTGEFFYYFLLRYRPTTEGYKRHFTILVEKLGFSPRIKEEEYRISKFLTAIDSLIVEAEREVSRLEQMKHASLQKMFPRPGASAPEIRFDGFTEPWIERKISDCASFSRGQGYTKNDLRESGTPIFLYGRLYTKYSTYVDSVDTYSFVAPYSVISKGNEVVMPSSGETAEDIAVASAILTKGIILSGGLNIIIPNNDIDQIFLALSLTFSHAHYELAKKAQGKSVVHIYNQDIADLTISCPSTLGEQKAIGEYFRNLDSLLSAKRQKLVKLRNIKQACLDKMFVNTSDL